MNQNKMLVNRIIATIALLFVVQLGFAQLQKTIHKTFQIDSAEVITLELYGEYQIETWAGDNILTETKIQVFNASKTILNFLLENGRYDIKMELLEKTLLLQSKYQNRTPIKTKVGESKEVVNLRIFIPDTFVASGNNRWIKIEEN